MQEGDGGRVESVTPGIARSVQDDLALDAAPIWTDDSGMSRPVGLETSPPMHETKLRLIQTGLRLMLARGYNATGVQDLLTEAAVPRGSFYHHFATKEDFAVQVIDLYASAVHELIAATMENAALPPLERVRAFFVGVRQAYESEGYLGCFLGALGQELSGTSELFRHKIEDCIDGIAGHVALCFEEARLRGDLPASADPVRMADILVDIWEGAALRSRLARSERPLDGVVDFYLSSMAPR